MEKYSTTPHNKHIIEALWRLQKIILQSLNFEDVVEKIVNGLLDELGYLDLGYKIIVLTLVDEKRHVLKRISLSQTEEAANALAASAVPFHNIDIPLSTKKNLLIKTLKEMRPHTTHHWPELFHPVLTEEQSLKNQHAAGIKTSLLYPVIVRDQAIGVLIFSMIKDAKDVSKEEKELIRGFTDIVGLAVENSRLYSSLADTTERLKKANKRLKELDDLKDEFVSVASHELRTPMTAIKSYLWLALNKPTQKLGPQMEKYLDISYKSTERLIRLVNDMLTISRIERNKIELQKEYIDLYEIVKQVYDELKIKADEHTITFQIIPDKAGFMVNADKEKIREVIQNIVGNALKFTPENGTITMSLEKNKDEVILRISDTGPGIPDSEIPNLFKKFSKIEYSYSHQPNQPGSGLGLYISKLIIALHGGKIGVESKLGVGTTFFIHLHIV